MKMTTLCYLEKDCQYLMLHRTKKEHDENRDKWIGVGGGFEFGESPEDCMRREVWEETGLSVTKFKYRGIVTFVSDEWGCEYMHLFTCTEWTGEAHECNEGDLEWVDKKKVPHLPLWAGDRIFLALLDSDEPFFSLKLIYQKETLAAAELNGNPYPI